MNNSIKFLKSSINNITFHDVFSVLDRIDFSFFSRSHVYLLSIESFQISIDMICVSCKLSGTSLSEIF
ncbi:MAG: hypothetical protein WCG25_01655 [bacterium]